MNILVVGGAGYLGGAVTDLLAQTNHKVKVYDILLYEDSYRKDVEFIYGDVRDTEKLKPQLDRADVVVWLAALVGDGACALNLDISKAVNQESVKWLADNYEGRIVAMSTCSVYGAQDKELNEGSPVNPLSVYAVTKLAAEEYLRTKNALIFRLGTLFGVGDQFSRIRLDLVVNTMTLKAYQHNKLEVFGGEQWRPLIHVKDVAQAIIDNLDTRHVGIYNLACCNLRIKDLALQVKAQFPNLTIEQTPMKFEDARNYRVSVQKARAAFGLFPKYSVDDGIREIKTLLKEHRLKDYNSPRHSNQAYLAMSNKYGKKE